MLNNELVTNVFEKTFVYEKEGLRCNISKLPSAGQAEPACICIAKYKDGQDDPIVEVNLNEDEQTLLKQLLFP